jgi:hypothetical protein
MGKACDPATSTCTTACDGGNSCNGACCSDGTCAMNCMNFNAGPACLSGVCGCNGNPDCNHGDWGNNCLSGVCGCLTNMDCPDGTCITSMNRCSN